MHVLIPALKHYIIGLCSMTLLYCSTLVSGHRLARSPDSGTFEMHGGNGAESGTDLSQEGQTDIGVVA